MAFNFANLDATTRTLMLEEFQLDVGSGTDYQSPRFAAGGHEAFRTAMSRACTNGTEVTLANEIRRRAMLVGTEVAMTGRGPVERAVPVNAPEMLAEGEFNRYYIRALCRRAIMGNRTLIVVRGKEVRNPRPESEAKLGEQVPPGAVLDDLRTGRRIDEIFGLPAGPNSGLTVQLE